MLISSSENTRIDTTAMVRAIKARRLAMRTSTERAPPQTSQPALRAPRRPALRTPGAGRTLPRAAGPPRSRRRVAAARGGGGVIGPLPRGDRLPDPDLVGLIVVGRVLLQIVNLGAAGGEDRAPQRQYNDPIVLQNPLDLLHLLASLVHVEGAARVVERLVELGVAVLGLVPRHAGAVAEIEDHHPERAVGPAGHAE